MSKTIAVIPVKGREPLLVHTVNRLTRVGIGVICCGHTLSEKQVCESAGATFILSHPDLPLGGKWQFCIDVARSQQPDSILIMGSSDWVSDNWCDVLSKDFDNGFGMTGTAGIYFLDIQQGNKKRMVWWGGYTEEGRRGEPIGGGRLISKALLDRMDWQLFDKTINHSLDWSTMKRIWALPDGKKLITCNPGKDIKSLSISTYKWVNKHRFDNEAIQSLSSWVDNPDEILTPYFPEALNLFGE